MRYREVLYRNYHSTQSGRAAGVQAKALFEREKRQFQREIIPLIKQLPKNARIFDLGCGSGSLLSAISDAGFTEVQGMDISPEQIRVAHEMGVKQAEEGDGLAFLKNKIEAFDLVCGMDIIEHFTKDELVDVLQDIKNSLKPGGLAIFRTPNLDGVISTVFANGDFTHENYLNASSAQQVCLACGFGNVEVKPGLMFIENPIKEFLRKMLTLAISVRYRLFLFATARSSKNVLWSPNMLVIAKR